MSSIWAFESRLEIVFDTQYTPRGVFQAMSR
jgi:hypothetical protein